MYRVRLHTEKIYDATFKRDRSETIISPNLISFREVALFLYLNLTNMWSSTTTKVRAVDGEFAGLTVETEYSRLSKLDENYETDLDLMGRYIANLFLKAQAEMIASAKPDSTEED